AGQHSKLVAEHFRTAGFRARRVDGDTPTDERRKSIAALAAGNLGLLTNCGLFGEGVDVPALGSVLLRRPTQSLALYLRMMGRALRPAPGEERALILNHRGNSLRHGIQFSNVWWLQGREKEAALVRQCRERGAVLPIAAAGCRECGFVFVPPASQK